VEGNRIEGEEGEEGEEVTGIAVGGVSYLDIVGNDILKVDYGVRSSEESQAKIRDNKIVPIKYGIEYVDQGVGIVEGNKIDGKEGEAVTGVEVKNISDIQVINNEIKRVSCGIRSSEESQVKVRGNKLSASEYGVECKLWDKE